MRPGSNVFPRPSTTCAPSGDRIFEATVTIFPSLTSTSRVPRTVSPSNTRAPRTTNVCARQAVGNKRSRQYPCFMAGEYIEVGCYVQGSSGRATSHSRDALESELVRPLDLFYSIELRNL